MSRDLTTGSEWKQILQFTLPLIGGNLLQQVYSLTDSLIVGNFAGQNALAAVGTSAPVTFLLLAVAYGFTNGVGIMAAQYFGAGDTANFRRNLSTGCCTLLGAAILTTLLGAGLSRFLIGGLLRADTVIVSDAVTYLRIYCLGLVFQFAYNTFAAILRSVGDSRSTMYFLLLSTAVNILLDFLMVQRWQVAGVAWATVIAQGISAAAAGIYLFSRVEAAKIGRGEFRFSRKLFRTSLHLGIPTTIQQCSVGLGMLLMQRLINSFGVDITSAIAAGVKVESFAMVPIMMFYMGLSNFTGQNMGAGRTERIRRGYHQTMLMALLACAVIILLIFLLGIPAMGLFGMNERATAVGAEYLQVLGGFFLIFCVMYVTNGVLQGSGDVLYPTLGSVVSLAVRVIAANLLAGVIGYRAIMYSVPIGWVFGTAIVVSRYAGGKWKEKGITGKGQEGQ